MKQGILEGLLFVNGEEGLTKDEIKTILEMNDDEVIELINTLSNDLKKEERGLKLVFLGNKYKLATKEEHRKYYELLIDKTLSSNLTQASLETLAIIAYNEPVSVGMIDDIRGVSSRDIVRKLLFRGLIDIAGRSDMPGKPMIYKTTNKFLDYFNLSTLDDLPKLEMKKEEDEEKDLYNSKFKEKNENI